jgi:hypothetical protein
MGIADAHVMDILTGEPGGTGGFGNKRSVAIETIVSWEKDSFVLSSLGVIIRSKLEEGILWGDREGRQPVWNVARKQRWERDQRRQGMKGGGTCGVNSDWGDSGDRSE